MIHKNIPLLILILCVIKSTLCFPTATQKTNATSYHPPLTQTGGDETSNAKLTSFGIQDQLQSDIYRKVAIENGMDPDAVAEVVRTGKPVVKVENDEDGTKRTTTYSLQPDGTISRHIRTEYRPTFRSSSKPFLPGSTRQPTSLPSSPSGNSLQSKKESDWEWNPTNVPRFGASPSQTDEYPSWTPNWQVPVFTYDQKPHVSQVPSVETTPTRLPEGTYWHYPGSPVQTDVFNGVDNTNVGTVTKTFVDGDNRKITTVHTVGPTEWHTKTVTHPWSEFGSRRTTTKIPQISQTDSKNVPTTLPSLEDFLKSQYATTTKSPTVSTDSGSRPVTTININDLPITEVFNTDKTNKNHVETLPDFKTQTKTYTTTIHTNGVPQVSDLDPNMKDILEKAGINPTDVLTSRDGTVTKTRRDPDGKVITTTYRIRTVPPATHTFATKSTHFDNEKPLGPFLVRDQPSYSEGHSGAQFPAINPTEIPLRFSDDAFVKNWQPDFARPEPSLHTESKPKTIKNPIDEFLAKLNLTSTMITASNGEIVKTIIDDNGRVLTASFVLSTVRNTEEAIKDKAEKAPIK